MIDKSPLTIRSMFSEIAPTYDTLNHLLSLGVDRWWRSIVARRCSRDRLVLDICCGTGDLSMAVASGGNVRVVGIDFSESMVRIADGKKSGSAGVSFCVGDALQLPFCDGLFDACTVAFGIRNTRDTSQCVREMKRVTRKGGKLHILEFTVPQIPLVNDLYLLYSRRVMSRIGNAVSHSGAYTYLAESVHRYYSRGEMCSIMRECGLSDVRAQSLTFGVCALYSGVIP